MADDPAMESSRPVVRLPFEREEYLERVARTRALLRGEGFDALLILAQESHYYLTGYDTDGFIFFQCAVLTASDGPITLLTRRPDLAQARETSIIEDIRIWWDKDGANPALDLRSILAEKNLRGSRIAIELNTHGLTGLNCRHVAEALSGWCKFEDGSHIVRSLRVCKSPAELLYVRRAADLCVSSLQELIATAKPGISDSDLKAIYLRHVLARDADMPPNHPLFNGGRRALYARGVAGAHVLRPTDQLLVEYPASIRRYNVKTGWMIILGDMPEAQRRMFDTVKQALASMTVATRPGDPIGNIFEAYRCVVDGAGYRKVRLGACGYSVGISYAPTSMDVPPMIYPENPQLQRPGMTLFFHVMLSDFDSGFGMGLGHTVLVTQSGCDVLNPLPESPTIIRGSRF
jgi:Xaa-Pro dipeptidase